jgi:hypothetical protein
MKFRTEIDTGVGSYQISHGQSIFLVGSCFTENIGTKLEYYRFQNFQNPNGIVYNPISIARSLEDSIRGRVYTEEDLVFIEKKYCSLHHHGRFNSSKEDAGLQNINSTLHEAKRKLFNSDWLFLTWGSAWAYRHKKTQQIVANCHKLPQQDFDKVLLNHNQIFDVTQRAIEEIRQVNKAIKVVVTVSPVRHWRDGVTNNQLSKSHLIIAAQELAAHVKDTFYFPAYELVMDDLRDYRFFKEDMLHPNEVAVEYIWEKFCHWSMPERTIKINRQLDPLLSYLKHRPLHITSIEFDEICVEKEKEVLGILLSAQSWPEH